LKLLKSAPPPRHHVSLSGALEDGRRFIVRFRPDFTAVVHDEIAEYLLPLTVGSVELLGEAPEGEEATSSFIEENTISFGPNSPYVSVPFSNKLNVIDSPEFRPTFTDLPEPSRTETPRKKKIQKRAV